jgi:threonine/homoserine/homoserine lactone efflux protein
MLPYIVLGGGFGFAAGIQPGPLQAFLLARVAAVGWRRTLPACVAPVLSDGPIAALVLLILDQISARFQEILRAGGGVLLLYLAWNALRQLRRSHAPVETPSAPRTVMQAVLVNILNPNPYIGWTLVLGPSAIAAWHENPLHAVALIGTFYGVIVGMLALFILLAGTARFLGPRGQRRLVAASAVVLAGLGVYLIIAGAYNLSKPPGGAAVEAAASVMEVVDGGI